MEALLPAFPTLFVEGNRHHDHAGFESAHKGEDGMDSESTKSSDHGSSSRDGEMHGEMDVARVIGNIPIAMYEGSPRRYGVKHQPGHSQRVLPLLASSPTVSDVSTKSGEDEQTGVNTSQQFGNSFDDYENGMMDDAVDEATPATTPSVAGNRDRCTEHDELVKSIANISLPSSSQAMDPSGQTSVREPVVRTSVESTMTIGDENSDHGHEKMGGLPTNDLMDQGRDKGLSVRNTFPVNASREVLIEGVLFRARYLGSTQLICEGQPTKATRMLQAEEAVSRIKVRLCLCVSLLLQCSKWMTALVTHVPILLSSYKLIPQLNDLLIEFPFTCVISFV